MPDIEASARERIAMDPASMAALVLNRQRLEQCLELVIDAPQAAAVLHSSEETGAPPVLVARAVDRVADAST